MGETKYRVEMINSRALISGDPPSEQLGMVLFDGHEYLQYFTVTVPLSDRVPSSEDDERQRFWDWLFLEAVKQIKIRVRAGFAPRGNRTHPIEIAASVGQATRRAATGDEPPVERVDEGPVIRFSVG